jgi:hypothetical protein
MLVLLVPLGLESFLEINIPMRITATPKMIERMSVFLELLISIADINQKYAQSTAFVLKK